MEFFLNFILDYTFDLEEALQVNPYAVDEFAEAIHVGLTMDEEQQTRRMRALAARVTRHDVYDWAASVLQAASRMAEVV